jgi:hypothetical protein
MQNHPPVEKPSVELGVGAALAQVDFSRRSSSPSPPSNNANDFGLEGMAFIAEFGIMVPISHLPGSVKNQEREIVGQKVVILNPSTRVDRFMPNIICWLSPKMAGILSYCMVFVNLEVMTKEVPERWDLKN